MQWSYRHNPDMEYGVEMVPSKENYESPPVKYEVYGRIINNDFGFMELFSILMVIPSMIFIYKFLYLLVLPLLPISVVAFELIREIAPLNKLFIYGGSFLSAYIFHRGVKAFFSFSTIIGTIATFIFLYSFGALGVYFLLDYYPQNEALNGAMVEMNNFLIFVKSKI